MYSSILANATLDLLKNRPRTITFKIISEETGLSDGWLREFVSGRKKELGVVKVERLYTFLSKKQINLV